MAPLALLVPASLICTEKMISTYIVVLALHNTDFGLEKICYVHEICTNKNLYLQFIPSRVVSGFLKVRGQVVIQIVMWWPHHTIGQIPKKCKETSNLM